MPAPASDATSRTLIRPSVEADQVAWSALSWIALIISVALGVGSILLNPMDRWDGAAHFTLSKPEHRLGLDFYTTQTGLHLLGPLIAGLGELATLSGLDYWIFARILLAICLLGISIESHRLARDVFEMSPNDARWVAALTVGSPAFVAMQSSGQIYAIFIWAVLLGHRWIHTTQQPRGFAPIGWLLILASFQLNSNLVFVLALEALRWIVRPNGRTPSVRRSVGLVFAAVGAYVMVRHVFGPTGVWASSGYNNFIWPTSFDSFKRLAQSVALWSAWLVLPLSAVALMFVQSQFAKGRRETPMPRGVRLRALRHLAGAALLAVGSVFPYIAVGKHATLFVPLLPSLSNSAYLTFMAEFSPSLIVDGFRAQNIRHALLLVAPLAILTVVLVRWVANLRGAASSMSAQWALAFATAHTFIWAALAHSYSLRQGLTDVQVVAALRTLPPPVDGALVLMVRTQSPAYWYDTSESNLLLYQAYGRAAWRGVTAFGVEGKSFTTWVKYASNPTKLHASMSQTEQLAYKQFSLMQDYKASACIEAIQLAVGTPSWIGWGGAILGIETQPKVIVSDVAQLCDRTLINLPD